MAENKELLINVSDKDDTLATNTEADEPKKPKKKKKKKNLAQKVLASLTDIMKAPISRWTTIAASFRYFGQFASDYYLPLFYLTNYSNMKAEFAFCYSLINLGCGFISSLAGGIISDRFGYGRPKLKA